MWSKKYVKIFKRVKKKVFKKKKLYLQSTDNDVLQTEAPLYKWTRIYSFEYRLWNWSR